LWSSIAITPTDHAFFSPVLRFLQSKKNGKIFAKIKQNYSRVFLVETMTKFAPKRTLQATLKNDVKVS
jgi:hypothetical protein